MPGQFDQSFRSGNWARDNLGTQVPMGSGSDAKEFMQLPHDIRNFLPAANAVMRGNLSEKLWPWIAKALAIAADHVPTKRFMLAIVAASAAQNGQATTNAMQVAVNMLAIPGLSTVLAHPQRRGNGHKESKDDRRIVDSE
jgi:hypothetical protein